MNNPPLNDRMPPYNEEAESAVLGALLLNYSGEAFDIVTQYLTAEDFYKSSNRRVFKAIAVLNDKGTEVDLLTLVDQLKKTDELEKAGGAAYVSSLTSAVPTSANVEYYAKTVQEASIRRKLLFASDEMKAQVFNQSLEVREIIEEAEKKIFDINDQRQRQDILETSEVVRQVVDDIEERARSQNTFTGIPTGFSKLDEMTGGLQNSEMIIIGARPSIGKTAFALNLASHMAVDQGIPTGFFSLEMSSFNIMYRLLALYARMRMSTLKSGLLKSSDWELLTDAAGRIYESPLYIDDTPSIRLLDLRAQARRMVRKRGVKVLFIDYIGLISPEDKKLPRHEQIAESSRSLKALARELNIPVVVLSQVGRQAEGMQPKLADLRESGSIEQDADLVMFLHRERVTAAGDMDEEKRNLTKIIVEKQRNGPTGVFDLKFVPETTRFENITQQSP